VCDAETSRMRRPWPVLGHRGGREREREKERNLNDCDMEKNCAAAEAVNTPY